MERLHKFIAEKALDAAQLALLKGWVIDRNNAVLLSEKIKNDMEAVAAMAREQP